MSAKGHNFNGKILSWFYCQRCGLILLNNAATKKAMNRPCPGDKYE